MLYGEVTVSTITLVVFEFAMNPPGPQCNTTRCSLSTVVALLPLVVAIFREVRRRLPAGRPVTRGVKQVKGLGPLGRVVQLC